MTTCSSTGTSHDLLSHRAVELDRYLHVFCLVMRLSSSTAIFLFGKIASNASRMTARLPDWLIGTGHWPWDWAQHILPSQSLFGPKKNLWAQKIILHILVLPPDPRAANFGWIQRCCLGCSKPWENIIPNPAVFIIFKSRPKFGILGTINHLILLDIHD